MRLSIDPPISVSALARLLLAGALLTPTSGCQEPAFDSEEPAALPREAWSHADDPRLLDDSLHYVLDELPVFGVVKQMPWPGGYWPSYNDSINFRWAGENSRSPAEKYGLAFGKSGVEDAVSRYYGARSLYGDDCRRKSDCEKGEQCARRRGEKEGVCTPSWVGLCHGWAPASIMEPEPRKAVTYNGVRFEINDLKALLTIAYDRGLSTRFISLRCNEDGDNANIAGTAACKDTNPGTFHLIVANLIGIDRRAFIEDRVYDDEVWNFPVIAYRVTRNRPISATSANKLLGAEGSKYRFNHKAVELRQVRTEVSWVGLAPEQLNGVLTDDVERFVYTDTYNYILELDDRGRIIGGEWTGYSRTNHPDFLWLPTEKRDATVAGKIKYSDVRKLLELAGS